MKKLWLPVIVGMGALVGLAGAATAVTRTTCGFLVLRACCSNLETQMATLPVSLFAGPSSEKKADAPVLEGEWIEKSEFAKSRWGATFEGSKLTLDTGGGEYFREFTFRLDPKDPSKIDLILEKKYDDRSVEEPHVACPGILHLDEATGELRFCWSRHGPRPTAFDEDQGETYVFERLKK